MAYCFGGDDATLWRVGRKHRTRHCGTQNRHGTHISPQPPGRAPRAYPGSPRRNGAQRPPLSQKRLRHKAGDRGSQNSIIEATRAGAGRTLIKSQNVGGEVVTKVGRQMRIGRPPIGEKAMTSAERVARWRERHARKHAPLPPRATTMDDWVQLFPKQDDWDRWLGRKPWDEDNV
jgi:hypothetical protein